MIKIKVYDVEIEKSWEYTPENQFNLMVHVPVDNNWHAIVELRDENNIKIIVDDKVVYGNNIV